MGQILAFPSLERKPILKSSVGQSASGAQILFFTGVRYSQRREPGNGDEGSAPVAGRHRGQTKSRRRKA